MSTVLNLDHTRDQLWNDHSFLAKFWKAIKTSFTEYNPTIVSFMHLQNWERCSGDSILTYLGQSWQWTVISKIEMKYLAIINYWCVDFQSKNICSSSRTRVRPLKSDSQIVCPFHTLFQCLPLETVKNPPYNLSCAIYLYDVEFQNNDFNKQTKAIPQKKVVPQLSQISVQLVNY